MNKIILCEGKTDAVLLSYYLGKVYKWEPIAKKDYKKLESLNIKVRKETQCAYWYNKGEDYLLICAVGGCNNFANFYKEHLYNPIVDADAFHRMVVVTDCDNNTEETVVDRLYREFEGALPKLEPNNWITYNYKNSFEEEKSLDLSLIVIPTDKHGALETVLLDAISEEPYNKKIVDECIEFVDKMVMVADRYITSDRLALKAKLGTTFAIQSPEKVFDFINDQLRSIAWEKSEVLKQCFALLKDI